MYILSYFVPETHLEVTKKAIFAVGAGSMGHYSHCAWQTLGEGQFMSLPGSNAFIGEVGKLERISEYKVEMMCTKEQIKDAVAALKEAHPYETPSYQVFRLETIYTQR
ncbi:MAG: NGG1p interacting factor NIF3 [Gammaproteobacteria bacterium]|nr:NGG1p interacting factor NIF3 [Gammaproteobacteria bacterium]